MIYKGKLIMNDGMEMIFPNRKTKQEIILLAKQQLKHQVHYYRKDGVEFGRHGKWFTYEEEHNGLKELIITVYAITDIEVIKGCEI